MNREEDIEVLAKTLWAEARGEGEEGMIAVAWAIRNRVEMDLGHDNKPDWWGEGYIGVCQAPWQFSCWNKTDPNFTYLSGKKPIPADQHDKALACAIMVVDNVVCDPTGGATHYYALSMTNLPKWAKAGEYSCRIGRHIFYKNVR